MAQDQDFQWVDGITFKEGMELREAQGAAKQELKKLAKEQTQTAGESQISDLPIGPAQQRLKDLRARLEDVVQSRANQKLEAKEKERVVRAAEKQATSEAKKIADEGIRSEKTEKAAKPLGPVDVESKPSHQTVPPQHSPEKEATKPSKKKETSAPVFRASPQNSPVYKARPCPLCKQSDQIRKYSGIVASQTSTTTGRAVTDRGLFKQDYVTTSESTSSSQLAQRLKPPSQPWGPGFILVIGVVSGVVSVIAFLPFLIVSLIFVGVGIHGVFTVKGKEKYQKKLQVYFDKKARFENTYYCSRCDFIYS